MQPADLPALATLKADPRVFAVMLGGVRNRFRAAEELAADIAAWSAHGYGTWAVRQRYNDAFLGITALQDRADGRGVAVRFAFHAGLHGRGYAREAAGAALLFGHEQAGLARLVAVARESNYGSRVVLGGIGMTVCEHFIRGGEAMVTYQSVRNRPLFPRILVGA